MDEGQDQTIPLGARKTYWPAAATFARNDLLFTMSDNTHKHTSPWWARFADADSCLRMSQAAHSRTLHADRKKKVNQDHRWWSQTGSNRRPPACKAGALPTELCPRLSFRSAQCRFVLRREPAAPEGLADRATWWAREDLNLRPHAYQARALTS